jgi:serine O-acetyltransferase
MARDRHRPPHPPFFAAVVADARVTLLNRSEPADLDGWWRKVRAVVRLMFVTDAFFAHMCYRAKARLRGLRVPILPLVFHRLSMMTAQVCIGDPVLMEPGVYIAHGQVVIDGIVTVRAGTVLLPWVTIGLKAGDFRGPTIGKRVNVGTGAKIIGPVKIGKGAMIGANAVVLTDVPAGATAVGVPARIVTRRDV